MSSASCSHTPPAGVTSRQPRRWLYDIAPLWVANHFSYIFDNSKSVVSAEMGNRISLPLNSACASSLLFSFPCGASGARERKASNASVRTVSAVLTSGLLSAPAIGTAADPAAGGAAAVEDAAEDKTTAAGAAAAGSVAPWPPTLAAPAKLEVVATSALLVLEFAEVAPEATLLDVAPWPAASSIAAVTEPPGRSRLPLPFTAAPAWRAGKSGERRDTAFRSRSTESSRRCCSFFEPESCLSRLSDLSRFSCFSRFSGFLDGEVEGKRLRSLSRSRSTRSSLPRASSPFFLSGEDQARHEASPFHLRRPS